MKTRKIIALGLAAVMTAGMLTGCGGSESKENASNDKGEEVVTLKWVTIGNGMPSNYDSWIGKVNDYIGEKIGVNLEMEVIPWGDWDNRRNITISTNEPYDIIFGTGNNYADVGDCPVARFFRNDGKTDRRRLYPERFIYLG